MGGNATLMDRPMPFFVFDRDGTGHPWERHLRELIAGPDGRRRAIAENWCMDHRISVERETNDLLSCGQFVADRGGEEWFSSLPTYRKQSLYQPFDPAQDLSLAYLAPWSDSNLIQVHGIAPFNRLCHVGSLRNIVWRILGMGSAIDASAELFARTGVTLPEKDPRTPNLWLDNAVRMFAEDLNTRGKDAVRSAARILHEALGSSQPLWWACFAGDLKNVESWPAIDLCQALGLGHFEDQEDWLVVWIYEVKDAGPLYRPTVAEAGDCPFHYPSPPGVQFGMTMPLDPKFEHCWEVVHRTLRGPIAEAACTGELLHRAKFPFIDDTRLLELRGLHRARLRAWHDRHSEP
jgi:hypothetical protein